MSERNIKKCRVEKEGYVVKGKGSERKIVILEALPHQVGTHDAGYSLRMRTEASDIELGLHLTEHEYASLLTDLVKQLEAMQTGKKLFDD